MFDVIGAGFGPSNLALAVCIREHNENARPGSRPLRSIFFERQESFQWHKEMQIDDATMQVSFLKDIVTLRNPTSRFSFLNYLKHQGRLEDFINLKTFYPTRIEYNDYLQWVASQESAQVRYASLVEEVRLPAEHGNGKHIEVLVRNRTTDAVDTYCTRNLVLGTGLRPKLPPGVTESPNVVHSAGFLGLLDRIDTHRARRFLVVGGGQSAAEIVNHLHDTYQHAEVVAVFPAFGYKPADDSNFVNQIFDPAVVDLFYTAPDAVKSYLLDLHSDTNYSVVDAELIATLYRKTYEGKVRKHQRLSLRRLSRLESLESDGDRVTAFIRDMHSGVVGDEHFDAAILATGYYPPSLTDIVPSIAPHIARDPFGEVVLDRHYSVKTHCDIGGKIYLQGASESQHGFTNTLLSALPLRSQEILQDILERQNMPAQPHAAKGMEYVA